MVPYKYALYSSEKAMRMYIEFLNIQDNPLSFEVPNGFIITEDMMQVFIVLHIWQWKKSNIYPDLIIIEFEQRLGYFQPFLYE